MSPLYQVATFYQFVELEDCDVIQTELRRCSDHWAVRGTILLATEGINGTIAGLAAAVEQALADLQRDDRFNDLNIKYATASEYPFKRLKIKIKPEIVTFGQPDANPNQQVGTYVQPQDWNQLIRDPGVTLVDTRNNYEVDIGTFQGSQNPHTESFREFPDYVEQHLDPATHPKVAMFCTGGIRCEKATAYLLNQGFQEVYHLQGGILKYLEVVSPEDSLWQGDCFVFDHRVAVQQGLEPGHHRLCEHCGYPIALTVEVCPDCDRPQSTSGA